MSLKPCVNSLYDLCKSSILYAHPNLRDIESFHKCLPKSICTDLIKTHQTNCVTELICYFVHEKLKICRECIKINPIPYKSKVVLFATRQRGSTNRQYECSNCQLLCVEENELRCAC